MDRLFKLFLNARLVMMGCRERLFHSDAHCRAAWQTVEVPFT
jgi:hypothetical protein